MGVGHYQLIEHVHSSKHHRSLFVVEGLNGYRLDIVDDLGIVLIDIKENQKAFAPDDWSSMLGEFSEGGQDVLDKILAEEVPQHSEGCHHHEGILWSQVFYYGVVHE